MVYAVSAFPLTTEFQVKPSTVDRGGGGRRGNYPEARAQKRPAKNSVYEDISYIIIIITNLQLGHSKTFVS